MKVFYGVVLARWFKRTVLILGDSPQLDTTNSAIWFRTNIFAQPTLKMTNGFGVENLIQTPPEWAYYNFGTGLWDRVQARADRAFDSGTRPGNNTMNQSIRNAQAAEAYIRNNFGRPSIGYREIWK